MTRLRPWLCTAPGICTVAEPIAATVGMDDRRGKCLMVQQQGHLGGGWVLQAEERPGPLNRKDAEEAEGVKWSKEATSSVQGGP